MIVRLRPAAERYVDEQAGYLVQHASIAVALRFYDAVERSLNVVAAQPEIGPRYGSSNPRLDNVRYWPIKNFSEHLIFYAVRTDGIEVLRVLHGRRDLKAVLD